MATKKLYSLTEEHRKQLKPWTESWIKNALSTSAMTEDDRNICVGAVKRLYRAANLEPPLDRHIIFVPSPFVVRFASGFAAWILYSRKRGRAATDAAAHEATDAATYAAAHAATYAAAHEATYAATHAATYAATHEATDAAAYAATHAATHAATDAAAHEATDAAAHEATDAATYAATDAATYAATHAATRAATYEATHAATRAATEAATRAATREATYAATHAATEAATDDKDWFVVQGNMLQCAIELGVGLAGLTCAQNAYNGFWQGGNQWSAIDSFVSFFRHVAKLDLNYAAWESWETLSLHSGPRAVHEKFCLISDRPEVLTLDDQNRPHNDKGPFCRWRDGSALYAIHGTRVPAWIIERPESITGNLALSETNSEIRRIMIERIGMERFIAESGAKSIHKHDRGELFSIDLPEDPDRYLRAVRVICPSTGRTYFLRVPPGISRADDAVAWTFGFDLAKQYQPEAET